MQTQIQKYSGFSLYELMTALAVFGILTVAGVPSYISFVRNGELSSNTINLYTDLLFARSEARKRKTSVVVCRSAIPTAATPVCGGGTANDWSTGWFVFADVGGTTGAYDAGTDALLRVGNATSTTIKVIANNNAATRVTYDPDGSLNSLIVPVRFAICDDRDQDGNYDEAAGRDISIVAVGAPEITTGNIASCDSPA